MSESRTGATAPVRTELTLLVLHLQHDLGPLVEGGDLLLSAGHGRVTGVLHRSGDRFRSRLIP